MAQRSPRDHTHGHLAVITFGNIVEWYCFSLFGYLATRISTIFFPANNPDWALIATYLTFGAGMLARPLGGLIFGRIGDKQCRYKALHLSIMLMVIPTFCIGLLPGYKSIGIFAPIALIVFHLFQGCCVGGQYSGATTIAVELGERKKQPLYCAFNYINSVVGFCTAIVVTLISIHSIHHSWGWRIPFLLSPLLIIAYLWVRHQNPGLPDLDLPKQKGSTSILKTLRSQSLPTLVGATLLNGAVSTLYYLAFVYMIAFLIKEADFTLQTSLLTNGIATLASCVSILLFAYLAGHIGKRITTIIISILTLLTLPFWYLISPDTAIAAAIIACLFTMVNAGYHSATTSLYPTLFPASVRYTAVSLCYNLGIGLFGGFAPAIATALNEYYPRHGVVYFAATAASIAIILVLFLKPIPDKTAGVQ